jgi:hypothetical protein
MSPLPNFFVIGANKAGTTSLHQYLAQHPDVYMSPMKEPMYYAPEPPEVRRLDPAWRATAHAPVIESLDEYLALFEGVGGETAIGESSTGYLSKPQTPGLIREAIPHAKLVAVLRNPTERAFSAYCMHRQWGVESLSFAEAVRAELDQGGVVGGRRRIYVKLGFYGQFLTRYLEHFPREQLRIFLYEDLRADSVGVVSDIFEFLGVDPSFAPETESRYNVTRYEPKHKAIDRVVRSRPLKAVAYRLAPDRSLGRAREFMRRKNSLVPEFPDDVRRRLQGLYREDIELTQRLIDRDLSAWSG